MRQPLSLLLFVCFGIAIACPALAADGKSSSGAGIALTVGVALYDGNASQCGEANALSVSIGDQVDVCYTVTNSSGLTLNYQSLSDDVAGVLLHDTDVAIAPGASYQFHRVFSPRVSQSPTATWTAQDALAGYGASEGNAAFVDISATGSPLSLSDDDDTIVTMPFAYTLYGQAVPFLCINNNGFIVASNQFDCSGYSNNAELPFAAFPSPAIMPFWDDLYDGGNVYYQSLGDAPNRQFVVEWFDKNHYDANQDDPGGITFEVVFNEADTTLDFVYQTLEFGALGGAADDGLSATVGMQESPTLFNTYSYDTASLHDGQVIHWAQTAPTIYSATQQVTIEVGAPVLALDAQSLSATAAAGQQTTATLGIGNSGNRDLHWSLDEAVTPQSSGSGAVTLASSATPAQTAAQRSNLMRAAPVPRRDDADKPRTLAGAMTVPAFLIDEAESGFRFGSLDASQPSTFAPIAALASDVIYRSGTFVGGDFSREYLAGNSNDLHTRAIATIDTATGMLAELPDSAPLAANEGWIGLKWDASTSTLYGAACDPISPDGECHLYYVDPLNGSILQGPAISGFQGQYFLIDIAISPQGLMYSVDIFSGAFIAIDKLSGAAHVIGNTGVAPNFAQSLDFDASSGTLYWPSYDVAGAARMLTIDINTGSVHTLGALLDNDDQFGFAIATLAGACAQPDNVPWLSETAVAGTTLAGNSDADTIVFDASSLSPGTYSANLCVSSDDPDHRLTAVPVSFTVLAPDDDLIFADGFDPVGG
ncbi:MAG: hypothetical protein ABI843_10315 [Dokdonella sp.]